jgi:transmembrane sensor
MDSPGQIKDAAARWFARRGSEGWSPQDEAELSRWLAASTGNQIAYLRLEAAWQAADRLKVLGAGFERGAVPGLEDFRASPFFKHVAGKQAPAPEPAAKAETGVHRPAARAVLSGPVFRWAAAAAVLLPVAFLAWNHDYRAGTVYSTPIGVTAAVPLSDGSKVTLNTDSEIRVDVTETERRINLEQGEAFFDVAKDPSRPFVVKAGNKRIIAVGTQFSVRRDEDDVRVVVTEGAVRVEQPSGDGVPGTKVSAGGVARTRHAKLAVQERPLPEVEELLSWRTGYVVFHETSLADAVAELNRYNVRQIVLQDPVVADIVVSGNFRATNIDSFVGLLEDGFAVAVNRENERIVLSRR